MQIKKVGDWKRMRAMAATLPHAVDAAVKQAMRNEANFLKDKMIEGIREQAPGGKRFKPISPYTAAVRRFKNFMHDKALIKSGTLMKSIHVFEEKNNFFIGVRRTKKDGKEVTDIAQEHEEGAGPIVIQITPKMRRFLMLAFKESGIFMPGRSNGNSTMVIKIPARPFIAPVVAKYGRSSKQRVMADLEKILRTKF